MRQKDKRCLRGYDRPEELSLNQELEILLVHLIARFMSERNRTCFICAGKAMAEFRLPLGRQTLRCPERGSHKHNPLIKEDFLLLVEQRNIGELLRQGGCICRSLGKSHLGLGRIADLMRARNPNNRIPVLCTVLQEVVGLGRFRTTNVSEKSQMRSSRLQHAVKAPLVEVDKKIACVLETKRHGCCE